MEDGTDDTELLLPKQHSKCHAFCGFWKIITYLGIIIGVTLICTWSSLNKGSFQLVDSGSKYSLKWACYSEEIVEYAQKIDKTKAYSTIDDSNRYPSCDELCLRDVNCILYVKEFPLFEESSNSVYHACHFFNQTSDLDTLPDNKLNQKAWMKKTLCVGPSFTDSYNRLNKRPKTQSDASTPTPKPPTPAPEKKTGNEGSGTQQKIGTESLNITVET